MTTVLEQVTAERCTVALAWNLKALAGRPVAKVRITPVMSSRDGRLRRLWTVLALDFEGREIPLPGLVVPVTNLLRNAFPDAEWGRSQSYNTATGRLTRFRPSRPKCLRKQSAPSAAAKGGRHV